MASNSRSGSSTHQCADSHFGPSISVSEGAINTHGSALSVQKHVPAKSNAPMMDARLNYQVGEASDSYISHSSQQLGPSSLGSDDEKLRAAKTGNLLTRWKHDHRVILGASRLPSSHNVHGQVWHAEATWQSTPPSADSPEEYDPSRLPPMIFPLRKEAREIIEKEIRDLLHIPADGIPPLKTMHRRSPEVRGIPIVRPTLTVRIKSTCVYKARLCLRGDLIDEKVGSFSSSPTKHRPSLRVAVSCIMISGWTLSMLDVTRAFRQSDPLPVAERCDVIVPPYISPQAVKAKESYPETDNDYEFVILMNKPLYGSRTAPLRWWLKISQHMRQWCLRQHRLDICMYTWREYGSMQGIPSDLIIVLRVDDFLVGHSARGLHHFTLMLKTLRTGELCALRKDNPMTYLGINIPLDSNQSIVLSQHEFISRFRVIGP